MFGGIESPRMWIVRQRGEIAGVVYI